jgi:hypothetical protein
MASETESVRPSDAGAGLEVGPVDRLDTFGVLLAALERFESMRMI